MSFWWHVFNRLGDIGTCCQLLNHMCPFIFLALYQQSTDKLYAVQCFLGWWIVTVLPMNQSNFRVIALLLPYVAYSSCELAAINQGKVIGGHCKNFSISTCFEFQGFIIKTVMGFCKKVIIKNPEPFRRLSNNPV